LSLHSPFVDSELVRTAALACVLLPGASRGSTVVLLPAFEPAEVLDLIERWRCFYFFILPAMLQLVVEQARKIFHRKSPYAELLRGPGTGAPAPEIGSLQPSINAGGNCVLFLICLLPFGIGASMPTPPGQRLRRPGNSESRMSPIANGTRVFWILTHSIPAKIRAVVPN
jgi:hypothetical protein